MGRDPCLSSREKQLARSMRITPSSSEGCKADTLVAISQIQKENNQRIFYVILIYYFSSKSSKKNEICEHLGSKLIIK